jgi:hypothetical protein
VVQETHSDLHQQICKLVGHQHHLSNIILV